MLATLAGIAQFEREMMFERQRKGVTKTKGAGKHKGLKPIDTQSIRLNAEGLTKAEFAM